MCFLTYFLLERYSLSLSLALSLMTYTHMCVLPKLSQSHNLSHDWWCGSISIDLSPVNFIFFHFFLSQYRCMWLISINLFPVNFRKLLHDSFTEVCSSEINLFFNTFNSHYVSVETRLIHVTRCVDLFLVNFLFFFFPPFFGSQHRRMCLVMHWCLSGEFHQVVTWRIHRWFFFQNQCWLIKFAWHFRCSVEYFYL